ncbi:MAG: hypothetical protein LBQ60_11920 [Bacteroidales bacterium]|jgi:hypothetical protein|nr:hypothetical protein [Bacteroidales bacterium]
MKKVNFLFVASLFAICSVFVGCSDDDDTDPPTITYDNVQNNSVTLPAGVTSYIVNATIKSDENLKSVKVMRKIGSESTQVGSTITSFPDKKLYNLRQEITGITSDIIISVIADNGKERQSDLNIKFTSNPDPEPTTQIDTYTARQIKCAIAGGESASCAASADGTTFTILSANTTTSLQQKCDFIYFETGAGSANIYSPNSLPAEFFPQVSAWTTKNATTFSVLSGVNYDDVTAANIIETAGTPAGTIAEGLSEGSVVAFKTAGGKVGVFEVMAYTAGSDANGSVTINLKVVK